MDEPTIVRRTLFRGELMEIAYVAARPESAACGDIEIQPCDVVVLPLAGVFAKHDGPRQQVIATANHAVLVAADRPYRISFPGAIGDRCLTLRLSSAAAARLVPHAVRRDRLDAAAAAAHVLLPPGAMLARSMLWHRLARGEIDPLEIEELGALALGAVIDVAGRTTARTPDRTGRTSDRSPSRSIDRVKAAIGRAPEQRWTLAELAELAGITPFHLAHVFRRKVGESVYRYALRARLGAALDAVLDGDRGLTEIALDAGFTSHSHFTARFRALFGATPCALRAARRGRRADRALRKIVTARAIAAS